MSESTEHFRASGNVIRLLGEQLVSSKFIALLELVKNAYDADASEVSLSFELQQHPVLRKKVPSLVIRDNGHGMTITDIRSKWLILGTSNKEKKKVSPSGRRMLGAKGIGRFSIQKLGNFSKILTVPDTAVLRRKESEKQTVEYLINWDEVINPSGTIEEYEIGLKIRNASKRTKSFSELIVYDLRENWTKEDIEKMNRELSLLIPPEFSEKFKVKLSHWKFVPDAEDVGSAMLNHCTYWIKGKANGKSRISYEDDEGTGYFEIDTSLCGPFEFNIRAFDLGRVKDDYKGKASKIESALKNFHGIKIYRDHFRVKPYGDPGMDWLGLAQHRVKRINRFEASNTIGTIEITSKGNPSLVDQTNREGIMSGAAFEQLRSAVFEIVFHLSRKNDRWHSNRSSKSAMRNAEKAVKQSVVSSKKATKRFDEFAGISKKIIRSLEETNSELRANASIGAAFLAFGHDLMEEAKLSKVLVREILDEPEDLEYLLENAEGLKAHIDVLHQFISSLDEFGNISSRDKLELVPDNIVRKFFKRYNPLLSKGGKNIKVKTKYGAGDNRIVIPRRDLESILINFTTNAVQALESNEDVRRISIETSVEGKTWKMIFEDNGQGVDSTVAKDLFSRGVTTKKKAGGSGLGLNIVKTIVEEAGGKVSVSNSKTLCGASFSIQFPLV